MILIIVEADGPLAFTRAGVGGKPRRSGSIGPGGGHRVCASAAIRIRRSRHAVWSILTRLSVKSSRRRRNFGGAAPLVVRGFPMPQNTTRSQILKEERMYRVWYWAVV